MSGGNLRQFPPGFLRGTATAPTPVEGHIENKWMPSIPPRRLRQGQRPDAHKLHSEKFSTALRAAHPARSKSSKFFKRADCFLRRNFYSSLVQ
jgi:hypothetical protein